MASLQDTVGAAIEDRDWPRALELLRAADREGRLGAEELLLLAQCARWTGANDLHVEALQRAHAAYAAGGDAGTAARTALRLVHANLDLGEQALVAGWCARAEELLADLPECAAHGLLAWYQGRAAGDRGDLTAHEECARRAHAIARRQGDRGTEALALVEIGHVLAARGRTVEALEWIDRAVALALSGEVGLFEAGLVFCNAIWATRSRGEWNRACAWTDSATRWVQREQIGYFPGLCRVHRAEALRIRGRLAEAEEEALEAVRLLEEAVPRWTTMAFTELGEVRRRRGDLAGAMEAFHGALELGRDPEPGLARCIAAQGDARAAHRTLERMLRTPQSTLICQDRTNLLLARVELALAAGELTIAAEGVDELEALAQRERQPWDAAAAGHARGVLELARDRTAEAVDALLRARALWSELDAPYELAGTCAVLGRALLREGDEAGARLALEAARRGYERIGAELDRQDLERELADLVVRSARAPARASAAPAPVELRRQGDVWSLAFDARELRLRDSRGLRYLAQLLERPGADHAALVLAGGEGGGASERRPVLDRGDAGELLDEEARSQYRRRLEELEEGLEEARRDHDAGRSERLAEEKEALMQALAQAVGLGGRPRRAPAAAERARQSVTKALRGAIRRIAEEAPALGRHLETCVRTGAICRYEPDPDRPLTWYVTR